MSDRLLAIIQQARRRWRLRLTLRGLAGWTAAALVAVVVAAFVLDRTRYAAAAVRLAQALVWMTLAVLAWRLVVRALRRRVSDAQVALYLEEHEPALQGSLLAAVRFTGTANPHVSHALVDRLVADAVTRCETRAGWRAIETRGIRQASALLAATAVTALVAVLARPGFLASGLPFLLPTRTAASPYVIAVTPGDTLMPRGADIEVGAELRGFAAERVELLVRRHGSETWERSTMAADEGTGRLALVLFDVREALDYLVEAAGVRSRVHTIRVGDLPWVAEIAVTVTYPAYTGLAPRHEEGGDVSALRGSTARITFRPTLAVTRGALIVLGRDTVPLAGDTAGTWSGSFVVRESGEYRVVLPGPDDRLRPASSPYAIAALDDQPPAVEITRPGRDADATAIEEVFVEARAEDDFGVRSLSLVYRVNGGPERTVPLAGPPARRDVVAGHTLFLEEMALQAGDVISYYARAEDGRAGAEPALSDIYFLAIRPFDRRYREAEQNGQPGQGGMNAGELTERQRQIVAATFRVQRERARTAETALRDDLAALTLSQGRLREDVATLVRRIRERNIAAMDTAFAIVAGALDTAIAAMHEAEDQLGRRALDAALPPEQRALTWLQRAEAVFDNETEVSRGQQGGGGRPNAQADELADLFELELDRMRNQYETMDRAQQQNADEQVDEIAERLRELARRQQQEAERRRAEAGSSTGTPSGNQRRLADEADSIARQLERLSRERRQPELEDAARRLREAASQMRRSAASREGTASASAATERLRDAERELERSRAAGLQEQIQEARDQARRLAQQQDEVAAEVEQLGSDAPAARAERLRRLGQRKDLMANEVGALDDALDRLARDAQRDQPAAANRLRDAANGLREGRTEDMIRYSRGTLNNRSPDYARNFENQIGERLDSLSARLEAAAGAVGEQREDRVDRALERTRDVARALESLGERMRERQQGQQQQGQQQQGQQQQGQQQQEQPRQGQQPQPGQRGAAQPGGGTTDPAEAGRQLSREMRERMRELRDIREALRREGIETRDLEGMIAQLGRTDAAANGGTDRALAQLQQVIVPGLREFEFGVRRSIGGSTQPPRVPAEGTVPPRYRNAVEEYYRSLSERGRP